RGVERRAPQERRAAEDAEADALLGAILVAVIGRVRDAAEESGVEGTVGEEPRGAPVRGVVLEARVECRARRQALHDARVNLTNVVAAVRAPAVFAHAAYAEHGAVRAVVVPGQEAAVEAAIGSRGKPQRRRVGAFKSLNVHDTRKREVAVRRVCRTLEDVDPGN